jgi:hypothetical protein
MNRNLGFQEKQDEFRKLVSYQYGKRRNVGGVREGPQTLVSFKTKNICPLLFLPYGRGGGHIFVK